MNDQVINQLRFDANGLIPAVVQDYQSGAVLMVAYMNRESIAKSLETGETHFWSRSRQQLWHKGETSGNIQKLKRVSVDCDNDALLVQVDQHGNACHTGQYSCFFTVVTDDGGAVASLGQVLGSLVSLIEKRKAEQPSGSYTTYLFQSGIDKILKKIGEESAETIIAAKNPDQKEFVWEVADLVYHLLVLLSVRNVSLSDLALELEKRAKKSKKEPS